jgi:signal transduction histidine kinase
VLSLPLALLLSRIYQQLEREVFYQYRAAAEEVVQRINQRLADVLQAEEQRPFDEYSFLKVAANALFNTSAIVASPLSELPPQSTVPGVLGYFQINPDGSLQSPVLPDLDETELATNVERFGFGSGELAKRLALRNRLEELLLSSTPVAERRRRQKSAAQTSIPPPVANAAASFQDAIEREPSAKDVSPAPGSAAVLQPAPPPMLTQKLAGSRAPAYRERRKEQVALPEQSTVSQVQEALDKLSSRIQPASQPADRRGAPEAQKPAEGGPGKKERVIKLLTFEGEVDPFQFTVLGPAHLVFFRKAWHNNLRYIQGFVVEKAEFMQHVIDVPLSATSLGQMAWLTAHYQGHLLCSRQPVQRLYDGTETSGPTSQVMQPLYHAPLEAPLDAVEMTFSAWHMPRSAGASIVDFLALTLVLVLLAGHYGLYRLGMQQIELAAQRSDFVSAVSHELKTPLTAIRMYGEMLRAGWVQDEGRRQAYYDFIFFESERLSRLIANVLQLARLTNHDAPLTLKEYTLHQLLDVVQSKVATQAEAVGFELRFLEEGAAKDLGAASVLTDEDAFVQIFINLVDNALKFSANAEPRQIDVGLRLHPSQPRQAVLFVRDYGPGVAPDQMQRIFQLFYRAEDELTRQTKGTGIGLALVQALAVKMHAQVNLLNHNPGAEFQLIIPILVEG